MVRDGLKHDVFEGEFCEVVFGDVVEGDVLGCYGVAVFGSSPADAFWADCKPFCDLPHGVLVFPGGFGEFCDQVGAGSGEFYGEFFDDEVLRGAAEDAADSLGVGCVVLHAEGLFEGLGGGFHVQRRGRFPVTLSMSSALAGPMPRAVTVPGGISV